VSAPVRRCAGAITNSSSFEAAALLQSDFPTQAMAAPGAGRALQLIRCTAEGRFEVGEEAAEVLRTLRGPLGVVAVCGRARQGKSFILNQLATHGHAAAHKEGWVADDDQMDTADSSAASGFAVAPTHRPCTKVRSHPRRPRWPRLHRPTQTGSDGQDASWGGVTRAHAE
jgi:hypothetical protein